jgi:hypothetical protein
MVDWVRRTGLAILSRYTGYPDIPNGRPCGVWAYMAANRTVTTYFSQLPDGEVVRIDGGDLDRVRSVDVRAVDVPVLDPEYPSRPELYYAAIETNPADLMVSTLPKGTQDLIARRNQVRRLIELGQRRQLIELLSELGEEIKIDHGLIDSFRVDMAEREAELDRLHMLTIEALLRRGYTLKIESPFKAAIRETKEEHGFDLRAEISKVVRVDEFVELAKSKRRPDGLEHYVFATQVRDFDTTLPRTSQIVEEKAPGREGHVYIEQGIFLTLSQMWQRFRVACRGDDAFDINQHNSWRMLELECVQSRLTMLGRIERALIEILREQGLAVSSSVGPGVKAIVRRPNILRHTLVCSR